MARLAIGAVIERVELDALGGTPVPVPGPRRVHLQFPRFAGCPIFSSHLHGFAETAAAGINEVVVDVRYGRHADDQWSVDELLELAGS